MVEPLPEQYGPDHRTLLAQLVPGSGPSDTVQGEVLRASLRVAAEYDRHGCGNWAADPAFFDGFVAILLTHLCDGTFDADTERFVRVTLGRAQAIGHGEAEDGDAFWGLSRDVNAIEQIAVAWCLRHPELVPLVRP